MSYVRDFRLGSADFFLWKEVIPSWVCRFFYTRKSVVSYVRRFRLGSADFFLWESFRLGSAVFFYVCASRCTS